LARTLRALSAHEVDESRRERYLVAGGEFARRSGSTLTTERPSRGFFKRWLASERLVPAVLSLAGLLYLRGALLQLMLVFGTPPPASASRTTAEKEPLPAYVEMASLRRDSIRSGAGVAGGVGGRYCEDRVWNVARSARVR
jgi:hypothetical protein